MCPACFPFLKTKTDSMSVFERKEGKRPKVVISSDVLMTLPELFFLFFSQRPVEELRVLRVKFHLALV